MHTYTTIERSHGFSFEIEMFNACGSFRINWTSFPVKCGLKRIAPKRIPSPIFDTKPCSTSYTSPGGSGAGSYGSNFFLFLDSWGLFTLNVSMGKNSNGSEATWGLTKWNSQLFFRRCFRKNLNCGKCINDKQITFRVLQIWERLLLNHN